ncbi:hypothetical protein [Dactylosporangium sp. NPDC051541]|uniref:hypothetical protein n=1 Tax=Dactylosporangium sp. NPDC051541 TaxID=3363977 RepID=UPI003798CFAF
MAARFEVLDAGTQDVVATVDTDAHGEFTVAVPAGEYMLRAVLVGGAAARRPVGLAVSVTSGQYTRIVWRLDSGLR